jgi:DNA-binding HxlR family transcriptional regulator
VLKKNVKSAIEFSSSGVFTSESESELRQRELVVGEVVRIESSGMDSAVRQIGDSWSMLIVWSALQGTTRFDNFQSRLGVARNILSNRLSKLVEERILEKRPVRSGARRLEYRITGKGEALRPALELIEGWGNGASMSRPSPHREGQDKRRGAA